LPQVPKGVVLPRGTGSRPKAKQRPHRPKQHGKKKKKRR
jgi:hypothetical protein